VGKPCGSRGGLPHLGPSSAADAMPLHPRYHQTPPNLQPRSRPGDQATPPRLPKQLAFRWRAAGHDRQAGGGSNNQAVPGAARAPWQVGWARAAWGRGGVAARAHAAPTPAGPRRGGARAWGRGPLAAGFSSPGRRRPLCAAVPPRRSWVAAPPRPQPPRPHMRRPTPLRPTPCTTRPAPAPPRAQPCRPSSGTSASCAAWIFTKRSPRCAAGGARTRSGGQHELRSSGGGGAASRLAAWRPPGARLPGLPQPAQPHPGHRPPPPPRPPQDLTEATLTGAWLSIAASVIMALLLVLVGLRGGAEGCRERLGGSAAAGRRAWRWAGGWATLERAPTQRRQREQALQHPPPPSLVTPRPPPGIRGLPAGADRV
jgi:hypothetical protein